MTEILSNGDIRSSAETGKLAEALAQAQGEYPVIEKDKTATVRGETKDGRPYEYDYKYADIADVLAAVRPLLAKHGLAFVQPTMIEAGTIFIRSRLMHSSGEWLESEYPVASYAQTNHQKIGAALTYARRYAGCALLGVAAEEDVDAHESATADAAEKPRPKRRQEAPEVISAGGNGKPLPPVVGQPNYAKTETMATEEPHEIGTSEKNGKLDWIGWGTWLSTAINNAKSIEIVGQWIEQNQHLLDQCEKDAPKVFDRLQNLRLERLDFLSNPPDDPSPATEIVP